MTHTLPNIMTSSRMVPFLNICENEPGMLEFAKFLLKLTEDDKFKTELESQLPDMDFFDFSKSNEIEHMNKLNPEEFDCKKIELAMESLQQFIRKSDDYLSQLCLKQANAFKTVESRVENLRVLSQCIISKLQEVLNHSGESQLHTETVTSNLHKLEQTKNKLTITILFLKRLILALTTFEQIKSKTSNRDYKNLCILIPIALKILQYFHEYREIPKITDLLSQYEELICDVKSQLTDEFDSIFELQHVNVDSLFDAQRVVDAISLNFRQEILLRCSSRILDSYRNSFGFMDSASNVDPIQVMERKFVWLKRTLRAFPEQYGKYFFVSWNVIQFFSSQFCFLLRDQLIDLLDANATFWNAKTTMKALITTKEFEAYLIHMLQEGDQVQMSELLKDLEQEKPSISLEDINECQLEYLDVLNDSEGDISYPGASNVEPNTHTTTTMFPFDGGLRNCFTPYIATWIRAEETYLLGLMNESIKRDSIIENDLTELEDSDYIDSQVPRLIYASSVDFLASIKTTYQTITKFCPDQGFIDVFSMFKRLLIKYLHTLSSYLPQASSMSPDSHCKITCAVYETTEYLRLTFSRIIAAFKKVISTGLHEMLEFANEENVLLILKSQSIHTACELFRRPIQASFNEMSNYVWNNVKDAIDESSWVQDICNHYEVALTSVAKFGHSNFYRLITDEFACWFTEAYRDTLFSCQSISDFGSRQLLLDTTSLKNQLIDLPGRLSGGTRPSPVYKKVLSRELEKLIVILRMLSSSSSSPDVLIQLLTEELQITDLVELSKILRLRGFTTVQDPSPVDEVPASLYSESGALQFMPF